jgi:hypothetical protein
MHARAHDLRAGSAARQAAAAGVRRRSQGARACAPNADACVASMAACVTRRTAASAESGLPLRMLGAATTSRRSSAAAQHTQRLGAGVRHVCAGRPAWLAPALLQAGGCLAPAARRQSVVLEAASLPCAACFASAGGGRLQLCAMPRQQQGRRRRPHQRPGARRARACSQSRSATRGHTRPSRRRHGDPRPVRPPPPARCAPRTACW